MSDLIRRQDAANLLYKMLADDYVDGYAYLEQLRLLPSVESERTAKVETYTDDQQETWSVCECGTDVWKSYNYCPECGAKLDWNWNE